MSNLLSMMVRPPRALEPHQKIALAVVAQAFADASDRRLRPHVRAEAKAFTTDSVMLREWCAVAGLDPAFVRDVSGRYMRGLIRLVSNPHADNATTLRRHPRERITGRTRSRVAGGNQMQNQRTRQTARSTSSQTPLPAAAVSQDAVSGRRAGE